MTIYFLGLTVTILLTFHLGFVFTILYSLAYFFIVADLFVVLYQVWALFWPSTIGTVVHTWIEVDEDDEGNYYTPKIVYRYQVKGEEFSADHYDLGHTGQTSNWAKKVISRYDVDQPVRVYYQLNNPSNACLQRNPDIFYLVIIGFLSVFSYIMILLIRGL